MPQPGYAAKLPTLIRKAVHRTGNRKQTTMKYTLEINDDIALEAILESLGWSLGAIGKRLDNGSIAQRNAARNKWLALDDMSADLQTQKRQAIIDGGRGE